MIKRRWIKHRSRRATQHSAGSRKTARAGNQRTEESEAKRGLSGHPLQIYHHAAPFEHVRGEGAHRRAVPVVKGVFADAFELEWSGRIAGERRAWRRFPAKSDFKSDHISGRQR